MPHVRLHCLLVWGGSEIAVSASSLPESWASRTIAALLAPALHAALRQGLSSGGASIIDQRGRVLTPEFVETFARIVVDTALATTIDPISKSLNAGEVAAIPAEPRPTMDGDAGLAAFVHDARIGTWERDELKTHLAALVDGLGQKRNKEHVSPIDVALELLGGEMEAFVLFARLGHLDPPREDGKVPIGVLRHLSADPEIDVAIRKTAQKWAADQESRS